jgi:hypothetical protein
MRKLAAIVAVSATSACSIFAATAGAETSQSGCQAYGAFVAQTAHTLNSAQTPGGGGAFISGIATSDPGALADTATYLKNLTCP